MSGAVRVDLSRFVPNIGHVASPDPLGHAALALARKRGLPAVASVHTRFETYPRYYGLAFLEQVIESLLRRFYRRCDAIVAPSESMAQPLPEQRLSSDVGIWTRGLDRDIFHPGRRAMARRRYSAIQVAERELG